MPQNKTNINLGNEIDIENSEIKEYEEHNVTHSIFIDFIIHGYNSVTISFSVLDNENLRDEIVIAKQIANSLNVYSGYIQVDMLERKIHNLNDYYFTDSLNLIKVQFPDKINFLDFFYRSYFILLPPKNTLHTQA